MICGLIGDTACLVGLSLTVLFAFIALTGGIVGLVVFGAKLAKWFDRMLR